MRKHFLVLLIPTLFLLGSCGSKTDANEQNFRAPLTQYLNERGGLYVGMGEFPLVVAAKDLGPQDWDRIGLDARYSGIVYIQN